MKIETVRFVKGIKGTDSILENGIPQVAFIGRSNVGKSSTINCLVGKKGLVKTSPVAGKTREINFFLVNDKMYFVDLPGYGFARMSRKEHEKLGKHVRWYLQEQAVRPKYTVVVVDAYVGMTELDKEAIQVLDEAGHDVVIAANKIDKVKKGDIKKKMEVFREESGGKIIVPFSAKEKTGRAELLTLLFSPKKEKDMGESPIVLSH